jgi:hypothetical protein
MTFMIASIFAFSLMLWLGTYLISRDLRNDRLRVAGLSLTSYALRIALNLFIAADTPFLLLILDGLLLVLSVSSWGILLAKFVRGEQTLTPFQWVRLISALPFLILQTILPPLIVSLALSIPALTVAYLDAVERGEAWLPDVFRSFDYAAFMVVVFGGQVFYVMTIVGVSLPLIALLLGTVAASILIQVFSNHAQSLVDRIAFFRWARVRTARAELRAVADAIPRTADTPNLDQLSEDEFLRHTRRALSHFGDLPRLATNPLIYLPAIDSRLIHKHTPDNTLERAVELKALLAESIARLKPRDKGEFGTTNEWRHYNALYYPYVVGLKPYSLRNPHDDLDDDLQEVTRWFNTNVPERTLYNWQTAATKLVAQDLRERRQEPETA